MSFDPKVGQEIIINGVPCHFAEHPAARSFVFGQEGRAATVYRLDSERGSVALKVFKQRYRTPGLTELSVKLADYARLPGLRVCKRNVLTPQANAILLRQYSELTYAVVMPWISGATWLQVINEKMVVSIATSWNLARTLSNILALVEQKGAAHCDLSGANVLLPGLVSQSTSSPVELVDIEQFYAPSFTRPEAIPSGSDGYAHKTVCQGIWDEKADRFAGAILLAEILGWCDPMVREAAWGECFFEPQELQRKSHRYDILHNTLNSLWGKSIAGLFDQAWNSEILADCPTFGEWLIQIPTSAPISKQRKTTKNMPTIADHVASAEGMIRRGDLTGALSTYNSALKAIPTGSEQANTIRVKIQSLESRLYRNHIEKIHVSNPVQVPPQPLAQDARQKTLNSQPVLPRKVITSRKLLLTGVILVGLVIFCLLSTVTLVVLWNNADVIF